MSRFPPVRAFRAAGALVLVVLLTFCPGLALAQPINSSELDKQLTKLEVEINNIEGRVDTVSDEELANLKRRLDELRSLGATMNSRVSPEVSNIRQWIDALGPPPPEGPESPRIAGERKGLSQRLINLDTAMRRAGLLVSKANTLSSRVLTESRERFGERILARGPSLAAPGTIVESVSQLVGISLSFMPDLWSFLSRPEIAASLTSGPIYILGLALIIIGAAFIPLSRFHRDVVATSIRADTGIDQKARRAAREVFTRSVLPLLLLIASFATIRPIADVWPPASGIINSVMIGLVLVVIAFAVSTSALTPQRPNQRLFELSNSAARRWNIAFTGFAVVFALDQIRSATLSIYVTSFNTVAFTSAILVTAAAVLFIVAMWPRARTPLVQERDDQDTAPPPLVAGLRLPRYLAVLVMALVPFVAIAGYFALSRYLSSRTILTTLLIAGLWLLFRLTSAFFHRSAPRDRAPVASDERRSGQDRDEVLSWWLSVAAGAVLFVLGIALTAILWGASAADFEQLREAVFEGFDFAGVRISLGQILIALVVFGIGLWTTRLVQAAADRRVLPRLRVETGARNSIRSALGYFGVFIAGLVAIGVAGLNLTNAAIIAGALSVGIGFGLQAVVSNFVSGLILLFERPFKVGDWIVVAGAEGTVKRINVRATEIQTFDNATVIVPNSQFIAGPVTNWMHKDITGRVAIQVKISQRIEPEKVREILLAAAHAHPDVTSYPPPTVVLQSFSGDHYEFELRAFVRDALKMSSVKSDLNFVLARQLQEKKMWAPTA